MRTISGMIRRYAWRRYASCLALLCIAPLLYAQTATRERVTPDGPYRSQVRILDERPDAAKEHAATPPDDYAAALALRQRAFAHLSAGELQRAAAALEQALALDALAPLARAQMQANLGQLYLAQGRAGAAARLLSAARAAQIDGANLALAHARAALGSGDAATAATAVLAALAYEREPPDEWLQFAAVTLSEAGHHDEAIAQQRRLLARAASDAQRWTTLATLYARAGREKLAAATLASASAGGIALDVALREQLAGLYAATGLPDLAARQIEAITDHPGRRELEWLARLRHDAHDERGALQALEELAQHSGEATDWLVAGEYALATGAAPRAVEALGRAARANATRQRALGLLEAAQATRQQAPRPGSSDTGVVVAGDIQTEAVASRAALQELSDAVSVEALPAATEPLDTKTVPSLRVYGTEDMTAAGTLVKRAGTLVRELVRTSRRDRIEWTGPLQIVVSGRLDAAGPDTPVALAVAAPVRRVAPARGRFRTSELEAFRCAWRRYEGPWDGIEEAWRSLHADVVSAGLTPAGEARQVVFHRARGGGDSVVELQVGLR